MALEGFKMGFPKRVDSNQKEITALFRKMGASVLVMSELGKGAPDLAVGMNGCTYLVELKDGSKSPSAQKLTPCEQLFFHTWNGHVCIINSLEQVIEFVNSTRKK